MAARTVGEWLTSLTVLLMVGGRGAAAAPRCDGPAACYRQGRAATGGARRPFFLEGMAQARARLAVRAEDPEGLFWLAVNTGAEALERGRLQALPALPEMERLLLACHRVSPGYDHGAAARVLGRLYQKAPAIISIGSTAKARQWLETALAIDSTHPGNLAFAADFLADHRERARAVGLARQCLAALGQGDGDYGPDADEWRALAESVLRSES